eukprot:943131-Pyramimonas_sp.AAC.1
MRAIRAHYFLNIKQHEHKQEEIEKGGPHRCTALMGDGAMCNELFQTTKQLATHYVMTKGDTHGKQLLGRMRCVSSQCVICGPSFSSIDYANRHMNNNMIRGICYVGKSRADGSIIQPNSYECPTCDYVALDNDGLRRHLLVEHLQTHLLSHVLEFELPGLSEAISWAEGQEEHGGSRLDHG